MKNKLTKPYLIDFQKRGKNSEGFLSICSSNDNIPFTIKRIFWAYNTPESISRGRHAHFKTEMIIIAAKGNVKIKTLSSEGIENNFILTEPNKGLYIPSLCWHEMWYDGNTVQLVICSTHYEESDYIRDKKAFEKLISK